MTTDLDRGPLEERLAAALHARAELVRPDQLTGPATPPEAATQSHRGRWYAAAAAAAATALVWPALTLLDSNGSDEASVDPPGSAEAVIFSDVDGDGDRDRISIADDLLRIEPSDGAATSATLPRGSRLIGAAYLAGGGVVGQHRAAVVVVAVPAGDDEWGVRLYSGNGLDATPFLDPPAPRITASSTLWISDGLLYAGQWDPLAGASPLRVRTSVLEAGIDSYFFTEVGDWCWDRAEQRSPRPCETSAPDESGDPGVGPRRDLPQLFPAQALTYLRPGDPDWQLTIGTSALRPTVRLLPRGEGGLLQVRMPPGDHVWEAAVPGPVPAVVKVDLGVMFLVVHDVDGGQAVQLYAVGPELMALENRSDIPLMSGTPAGETDRYDFWVAEDGVIYSRRTSADDPGRAEVWRWDLVNGRHATWLDAVPLGEVCLELQADPVRYGRCGG
jgi:hypothetical protein